MGQFSDSTDLAAFTAQSALVKIIYVSRNFLLTAQFRIA